MGTALWSGYPPNWYSTNMTSDLMTGWEYIGAVESPELQEMITWLNKESDNFYAEMLLKTLSAETQAGPGSTVGGIQKAREILGSMGLDTTYVVMRDGSGLAGGNFLTSSVLTDLLLNMHQNPNSEVFKGTLPIMGEDGTLHYRMKSSPLRGQVQAKTGYVGGARSLSGYLTTELGNTLIFSMSANNFVSKVSAIDAVHDKILTYLYYRY
jgi:D-alanyl-D-alanine carboxypeptidase/D-alanyl-D-alanine-endopeptidase (penicillin-binding protein 4)